MEIDNFFEQAELSEASYADLEGLTKAEEIKAALIDKGFSETQATELEKRGRNYFLN